MPEPASTIVSSVGRSLVDLLKVRAGFLEGDIVLRSPADADQGAKLSLFLYHVAENVHLRRREPERIADDVFRPSPLVLDLMYLITPLAPEPDTALAHLEAAMLVFHDHMVLKPPTLPTTLVEAGNEAIRIEPHPLTLEETHQLWGIFPNKAYRLCVAYLVTPVLIPSTLSFPATHVVEKVIRVSATRGPR